MKIKGLEVVDAKKPMSITVLAPDIKKARRKIEDECAIAVACKREHKVTDVLVHASVTYVRYNGKYVRFKTPEPAHIETVAFDRGGDFQEGEYIFNPPSKSDIASRGRRTGSNAAGSRDKGSKNRTPKTPRPPVRERKGVRPRVQHG